MSQLSIARHAFKPRKLELELVLDHFNVTKPKDLIHSDVCGLFEPTLGGNKYIFFFINDYSSSYKRDCF